MAVDLLIKDVPEALVDRLRQRAVRARRSLQEELLVILRDAVAARITLEPGEVLQRVSDLGVRTPTESVAMIRGDRDAR
jgi:plasmid stability protein